MWFPISANPPLKQSLNSRKEYIHTFNYHQGLTSLKCTLCYLRILGPALPWGVGVGSGGMYGLELELELNLLL